MDGLRVGLKAFQTGAALSVGAVAAAEWSGIIRLRQGYCCGYERDILPTYVNLVWIAAAAACGAALLALWRAADSAGEVRLIGCLAATAGAALALLLLAYFAASSAQPVADADLSAVPMAKAYACGLALGLMTALLVELTGARVTAVPFSVVVASGVYYLIELAGVVLHGPLQNLPGGIGMSHAALSLGLIVLTLDGVLFGVTAACLGDRLARADWRRGPAWVRLVLGLAGLAVLIRACMELTRFSGRVPLAQTPISHSVVYGGIGLGIAVVARRRESSAAWLAVAAAGGLVLLGAAFQVALAIGPDLSGDGALEFTPLDAATGILLALIAGAVFGSWPRRAVWSRGPAEGSRGTVDS